MRVAVIIATCDRRDLLGRLLGHLGRQTRTPDAVVVSAPDESHVPDCGNTLPMSLVLGQRGAVAQRNNALAHIRDRYDVVLFLDDDFLPADDYVERTVEAFESNADWFVLTGEVLRDGVTSAGLSFEEGAAILAASRSRNLKAGLARECHGGYGCNMAVRMSAVGLERFDERLVLSGWQEDVDFTRRVARNGRIIRHTALRGVHLGTKTGRMSGLRFGYSQIVNPVYLQRKGTVTFAMAAQLVGRNVLANIIKSLRPEPWVDRRARLRGNLLGTYHVLRGRIEPEYIREL